MVKSHFSKLIPWGTAKNGKWDELNPSVLTSAMEGLSQRQLETFGSSLPPYMDQPGGCVLRIVRNLLVGKGEVNSLVYMVLSDFRGFLKGGFTKLINTNLDHSVIPLEGQILACRLRSSSFQHLLWLNQFSCVGSAISPILPTFLK